MLMSQMSPSSMLDFTMRSLSHSVGGHFFTCKGFHKGSQVSKEPFATGWRENGQDIDSLVALYESSPRCIGWAIPPGVAVVDVDAPTEHRPGKQGPESLALLIQDLKLDLSSVPGSITSHKGMHFYFRIPQGVVIRGRFPDRYPDLDVKTHGGFVILPGSPHWEGGFYWANGAVDELGHFDVPEMPAEMFDLLKKSSVTRCRSGNAPKLPVDLIEKLLAFIPVEEFRGKGGEDFWRLLASVKSACDGSQEGLDCFIRWCRKDPEYDNDDNELRVAARWNSTTTGEITVSTLLYMTSSQLRRLENGREEDWRRCNALIRYVRESLDGEILAEYASTVKVEDKQPDPLAELMGTDEHGEATTESIICGKNIGAFIRRIEQRYPILAAKYKLFVYENSLCEMARISESQWVPVRISPESMLVKLAETFSLMVEDERLNGATYVEGDWILEYARLVTRQTSWPGIPIVSEIVSHPIIDETGKILTGQGLIYKDTYIWCIDPKVQQVPDEVDWMQATMAAKEIIDTVGTSRFLNLEYASVWLAGFLSVVCRHAVDTPCPMIVVTSEGGEAGKTTMASVGELVLTGEARNIINVNFGVMAKAETEITSMIIRSSVSLILDDIDSLNGVESRLLNSLITSRRPSVRRLQTSDVITVPRGPQIWMTGLKTKLKSGSTLERRMLPLIMVSPDDSSRMSAVGSFDARLREQRYRLLRNAATVFRGWLQSGERKNGTWASFEIWDELIRQAIMWVGMPDPCSVRTGDEARVVMGSDSEEAKDERVQRTANAITLIEQVVLEVRKESPLADEVTAGEIVKVVDVWRRNGNNLDGLIAYRNLSKDMMSGSALSISKTLSSLCYYAVGGKVMRSHGGRPLRFRIARVEGE